MISGRDGELALLAGALERREPTVVVGPAGVGKSSLCREALDRSGARRESGALASLRWSPYLLFRRLLGGEVRDEPERVAAQVLAAAPSGLLLDDLQWADEQSLTTIAHLAGRLPLLATIRRGDPGASAAEAALQLAGFTSLELHPLDGPTSAAVLAEAHPELDPHEQALVLAQAGGNPLLLRELAVPGGGSPTLVRALQARLGDHPEAVRVAFRRLSVLGRPAAPDLLGPGSEALVAAGLARRADGADDRTIEVQHALLAEAVVEELGPAADEVRRDLAALVPADEAAFLLARAGERSAARDRALAAAEVADRRTAAELLVLAVDSAPPGDLDPVTRARAAEALADVGQAERSFTLCTAEGIDDLPRRDRGALRAHAARAAWLANRPIDFAASIDAALDDLRGSRTALEVQVLAGSTYVNTRLDLDGRPALERAREAVALADELGLQQGFARSRLASVLLTSGLPGWAELYREVIDQAERDGDDGLRITTYESLMLGEWIAGDIDRAVAIVDDLYETGARAGRESAWLAQVAYGAVIAVLAGAPRAATIDRWGPILREEALFRNRAYAEAAVVIACADLGRHRDAARVLDRAAGRPARDPRLAAVTGWAHVEAFWAAGRAEDAVVAAERVVALGVGDHPAAVSARLVGAHAAHDLGRPPSGPDLVALLPAWAGAPPEWQGLVALADDRVDDAVVRFDEAAAAWAGHDRRSEVRARWAAARAAGLGGHDDATDRLAAVERDASRIELSDLAARARRSLRERGTVSGSARAAGVGGLTARQEEVLVLVGDGLTSVAIAAELHVTVSTVDSLVRSAVRRLGAANRRAAAAVVSRHRNVPGGRSLGEASPGEGGTHRG